MLATATRAATAPRRAGRAFESRINAVLDTDGVEPFAERFAAKTGSTALRAAGQRVDVVGAVLTLVIVAVISYVGLDVVAEVDDSTDVTGNSNLVNASDSLDSGVEGAFSLMGVVFLVLLLSVIIGLFIGLRR